MRAKKTPQPEQNATAERITFTLFPKDAAAIKRLRNGLFADAETIANTSEILRFLLREAPEKLNSKRFLACREEMAAEDGRATRHN